MLFEMRTSWKFDTKLPYEVDLDGVDTHLHDTPNRPDCSRETRPVAPPTPTRNVLWISRGPAFGLWRPGGLSDARVIREGPTTADVYIDISPFYGMAPATVSGYRSGGRRYA